MEREDMDFSDGAAEGALATHLQIDPGSGEVLSASGSPEVLLGISVADLTGMNWRDALGVNGDDHSALGLAISSCVRTWLPPLPIRNSRGSLLVVDGLVDPRLSPESNGVSLTLYRLTDEESYPLQAELVQSGVVAMLGVDQLVLDDSWGMAEVDHLMRDIRGSLQGIVRKRDLVGMPSGRCITLVLQGVAIDEAQDICRAVLSHVNSMPLQCGSVDRPRICIGLAQANPGTSVLALVLQAYDAMLRVQLSDGDQRIGESSGSDRGWIAARSLGASSPFLHSGSLIFSDDARRGEEARSPVELEQLRPEVRTIETGLDGYVDDNMEGAIDQAIFLAGVDMPVAIIGPRGTGKLYVARIIHQESGGAPEMLVPIDCREFRSRKTAMERINRELERSEGKTLVFKSPQLMHEDVQVKLARMLSTRTLLDASPARYLPQAKYVALFPDNLDRMIRHAGLTEKMASVFAGFPIHVPPIKDRKQAVLRWAHKILGQESARQDRIVLGFTPDAEQAMLQYDWPGNISEMRQCIISALAQTDKEWVTPVDLGIFKGITADGAPGAETVRPFLEIMDDGQEEEEEYAPSIEDQLSVALGEAVHSLLEQDSVKPLGSWLEDEVVLATCDRYRGDMPAAATFLHTKSRNISRWMPKIEQREAERAASLIWQEPRRLVREWIRATSQLEESPLALVQSRLLAHVVQQADGISMADRARIMGVSAPTFQKRLQQMAAAGAAT